MNGVTPNINGDFIPRDEIKNMEESRHDIIVSQRFALYRPGENTRAVINRLKKEGINLRDNSPELFNESLFQVNSEANSVIILEQLRELGIYQDRFKESRWLHFTNRQLSQLAILDPDSNEFASIIKSLSNRLDSSIETTLHFWDSIEDNLNQYLNEEAFHEILVDGEFTDRIGEEIIKKKSIRTRLNPDSVSPTMVTLPDDFIHPYFNRVLTVREMARIQSFDDSFE